ncbi:YjgN family protein [Hylemonella sp. W303a]|uniref:YjgN family protein n=1 Tax=Hylemonella sp. W303a TaxID=3389873 RepID=UPI00396B0E55
MRSFEEEINEMEQSQKTGQTQKIRAIQEDVAEAPGLAQGPAELGVRFVGSGSEYFRIWIVNLLLTLVTLGLYYPFAKTRRLKYFYGATEVGGHPLSFHGKPWAMFRGYVLAALLVVLYNMAGKVSPIAGLLAFAFLMLAWPFLWHASLRFSLANTGWRGLRLRFTGTRGGAYGAFALLYAVLAVFVIGITLATSTSKVLQSHALILILLAYPVGLALIPAGFWLHRRYQQAHLAIASEQTTFDVGAGKFYRLFGVALLYAVLLFLAGALAIFGLGKSQVLSMPWAITALVMGGYLLILCVVGGYFVARLQNLTWNGTRSPGLAFRSALPAGALIQLWFKNWLLTLVTLGLYHPYAKVANARLRLEAVTLLATADMDELVAAHDANAATATGDAAGDLFGLDFGL